MVKKEVVIEYLKEIEKQEGILTPESVVSHASDKDSPIHDRFEWDNSVAAEKYRLVQARQLINEVKVEWQGRETEEFHNVVVTLGDHEQRGYVSLERVLSNEDLHRQVVDAAIKELRYWQEKYNTLNEFSGVINEDKLSEVEKSISK